MIEYEEDWLFSLIFRREGSVLNKSAVYAVPAALLAALFVLTDEYFPGTRAQLGIIEADSSQLWSANVAIVTILLSFRTKMAYSRFWEGTSLLHQMRGEWFDSVSCCVTFSRAAKFAKPKQVEDFRHSIVRLMSLCHGSALEEIAGIDGALVAIDTLGLDNDTLEHLNECSEKHNFNRVEVLLHLTQSLIVRSLDDGVLKIAPPILSRVFQTLSRGFVNLLNCKKISDTRFPFPLAQLISCYLMLTCVLTPMLISNLFVSSKVLSAVFTFIPLMGLFSLNFVAIELENPFGDDDNDLPLDHFQDEMNACLMMLLQDNADLVPGVRDDCEKSFPKLKELLEQTKEDVAKEQEEIAAGVPQMTRSFSMKASTTRKEEEEEAERKASQGSQKPAAKPPENAAPPRDAPPAAPGDAPSQSKEAASKPAPDPGDPGPAETKVPISQDQNRAPPPPDAAAPDGGVVGLGGGSTSDPQQLPPSGPGGANGNNMDCITPPVLPMATFLKRDNNGRRPVEQQENGWRG